MPCWRWPIPRRRSSIPAVPSTNRSVRRTLDYVPRELSGPQGGFCCGQDGDSGGVEGKYYTLASDELVQVLGREGGDRFRRWYDITLWGSFKGRSTPNLLGAADFDRELEGMAACWPAGGTGTPPIPVDWTIYAYGLLELCGMAFDPSYLTWLRSWPSACWSSFSIGNRAVFTPTPRMERSRSPGRKRLTTGPRPRETPWRCWPRLQRTTPSRSRGRGTICVKAGAAPSRWMP